MQTKVKLYTFFRSSASFRVRIALNHKGLKYEHAGVSLPKGEHLEAGYKSVNAQGLVPALEDGGLLLTQ
jgi:glutathione S-transferase